MKTNQPNERNHMKPKHSVFVRLKIEADTKKEANEIAEKIMRVGMTHLTANNATLIEPMKYWGLKDKQ